MITTSALTLGGARRDARSATWFDALAEGTLLIRRCGCGHHSRPDATACPACRSEELGWVCAAGTGTVVCLIREGAVTLGLVELDEGPWLHARLVGPSDVKTEDRVSLTVLAPVGQGDEPVAAFYQSIA